MHTLLEKIAATLAAENKIIIPKSGSVFEALEVPGTTKADFNVLANSIAIKLGNEISLFKNKMFPLLWGYSDMVKAIVASIKDDSELAKYTITEISIPQMLSELKDSKYLNPTREIREFPITLLSIPVPTKEEVKSFFKPKFNAATNIYASKLIDATSEDALIALWEKYLTNINKTNDNLIMLSYNTLAKLNDILLLLVVVSNIKNARQAGVQIPEDKYVDIMVFLYQELLNFLAKALDMYAFDVKYEKLILDSNDRYNIVVNKDVYETFLNQNGNPEVILGKMSDVGTRASSNFLKDILIDSEKFANAWNQQVKLEKVAAVAETVNKYKSAYYISVPRFFAEILTEDLKQYCDADSNLARANFMEYIITKEQSDILDVEYMAIEFFGHIIFPKTNFHRFQHYMMNYKKIIPDLSVDETATYAACDLIMDYLLSQVEVKNS